MGNVEKELHCAINVLITCFYLHIEISTIQNVLGAKNFTIVLINFFSLNGKAQSDDTFIEYYKQMTTSTQRSKVLDILHSKVGKEYKLQTRKSEKETGINLLASY